MKSAFIFLADGFEDIEALGTLDILRRGGVSARTVSISNNPEVTSAHGVTVRADVLLDDFFDEGLAPEDALVFPGGMPGAAHLAACEPLMMLMQAHYEDGGLVAAICAAPGLVLSQLKGISGATVTCFDGFEGYLEKAGARFEPRPAICSGRIITGRSAGHALSFGLEIVAKIRPEKVDEVRHALYLETI